MSNDDQLSDFSVISRVVKARRTNLRIDKDRPVDHSTVEALIELSTWAPNHHLTQPWLYSVVSGPARATMGEVTAEFLHSGGMTDEAKLEKTRTKYLRAPVLVMIASRSRDSASDSTRIEDRDAVASAVQTLLVAASSLGLSSYWGTGAICYAPAVKGFCGFPDDADVVAAIYLGWPIGGVPVPNRLAPSITWRS